MRRVLFLLTVGMVVTALGPAGAKAADIDQEIRVLRAENNLFKATLEQRNKEIKALKQEIEALKAEPAQAALVKLRKELAEAKARIRELSKELEKAKPVEEKEAQDDKPPVTMEAVVGMSPVQRRELPGSRVFGRVIVSSIEPKAAGMYDVTGIDTSGQYRIPLGSRSRATAHRVKDRWVQVRCVWQVPEATALRLRAGVVDGSEMNVAGKITRVKVEAATKDTIEVIYLYLEDASTT